MALPSRLRPILALAGVVQAAGPPPSARSRVETRALADGAHVCPAPGGVYSSGSALGLSARDVKHVAIAFHGQFLHGRTPTKQASAVLPPAWGDSAAARTWPVAFDAFVSTSTQQLEHRPCVAVDGQQLCERLQNKGGFRFAQCELRPYNGTTYIRWAFDMGLPWRDAARFSLYPHRVLSDFHTIACALERVRAHEARAGAQYDLIGVTRMDVFFYFLRALPPFGAPDSWYESVQRARVIGKRSAHKPLWEDRFVLGRRDEMLTMGQLVQKLAHNFVRLGNLSYPEAQLHAHFADDVLRIPGRKRKALRPFEAYMAIEGFKQNKGKFRKFFIEPPADIPIATRWRRHSV
ncbi:hypothetical protein KFE25_007103 [Diacronema lutheri]|uniref:Uncharacterized protein n=1 Tax=Diacronema lutheri TaxID=2081491 RepID=A0A8J6CEE6_DIALT|nr:hypothetical protein KFE25_007103 [Diacronema lutheri]